MSKQIAVRATCANADADVAGDVYLCDESGEHAGSVE